MLKTAFTGISFLVAVALARLLGPSEFGVYSYINALVAALAIPAQFGFPVLVVRETAKGMAREDYRLVKGVWRWTTSMSLLLSAAILLITILVIIVWQEIIPAEQLSVVAWALILVPLVALGNLRGAALRGLNLILAGQLPEFIIRPGLFLLFLAGFAWWGTATLDATQAVILNVVAAMSAFVVGAIMLWRNTPAEVQAATPRVETRAWILSALPLAFIAGMHMVNQRADVLLLGLWVAPADIGIYRVAVQLSLLAAFGLQAMNMVVAPRFAGMYERGEFDKLQRLATMSARVTLFFTLAATVLLVFLGDTLLEMIFGPEYQAAYIPLVILLVGQLINSAVGSVGFLLNMTGHERETAKGLAIAAVFNVLVNLLLIPIWGINGAAVATALSLSTWNVILWWQVRRQLKINSMAINFRSPM